MSALHLAAASNNSGGGLLGLLPLVLIFGVMYFLLLRPQRKRQKEAVRLQSSLNEGDEVVLNSGIYGFISAVEDNFVWLDIADKVEIRVTKGAIASRISSPAEGQPAADDKK